MKPGDSGPSPTVATVWVGEPMSTIAGPALAPQVIQATIDALSSPVRREILWMLWDAELPAGEIADAVGLRRRPGPGPGPAARRLPALLPRGRGCRVEVHQEAQGAQQAQYLTAAWSMVLGRLKEYADLERRPARTRRRKKLG